MLVRPRSAIIVLLATFCALAIPTQAHSYRISAVAASGGVNAAANPATGAISGKVTRLDGTTAIAGATVKAYQGIVVAGTATTNATGDYTIGVLSTGTYSVQASAVGYESTTQTGIAVTDGATTTLNVSLPVPINYVYDELGRLVATCDADPVNLGTGLFVYSQTDLVLPDVIPIALTRVYRPNDPKWRPFGSGTRHPYEMFLVGDQTYYTYAELILPDGGKIRFDRISSGTGPTGAIMECTASPTAFHKARLTFYGSRVQWELGSQAEGWDDLPFLS